MKLIRRRWEIWKRRILSWEMTSIGWGSSRKIYRPKITIFWVRAKRASIKIDSNIYKMIMISWRERIKNWEINWNKRANRINSCRETWKIWRLIEINLKISSAEQNMMNCRMDLLTTILTFWSVYLCRLIFWKILHSRAKGRAIFLKIKINNFN